MPFKKAALKTMTYISKQINDFVAETTAPSSGHQCPLHTAFVSIYNKVYQYKSKLYFIVSKQQFLL